MTAAARDAATHPTSALRELLALPVDVPVGGGMLQLRPMGWMQFANAIEPLMPVLDQLPILVAGQAEMGRDERIQMWLGALIAARREVAEFAAAATGFDQAEIEALPPTAFAELLVAVIEINADFFVSALPTLMSRTAGRMAALRDRVQTVTAAAASKTPSSA